MNKTSAYDKILDTAEDLIQTQGFNAFSFRDIALTVGIKTSSIHYHFPTKAELGKAVVKRHHECTSDALTQILNNNSLSCKKKIGIFLDGIFSSTYASDSKMCLGGMLASDVITLPEIIQFEVKAFFNSLEKWLEQLLLQGKAKGEFQLKKSAKVEAEFILSVVEGALLLARLFHDEGKWTRARSQIEANLW